MEDTRLLIVADAHFGAAPAADETAFLDFLDTIPRPGDTLLLAGDIFDYWFSYRRLIPRRCFRITAQLSVLARRIPIVMVGGNHDRWGGTFWREDAGIEFQPHAARIAGPTGSILLIHSDGLHEERPGASWMHRLTSSPAVIALYRTLHPDLGFWLADKMGHNLDYGEAHPEAIAAAAARQAAWATAELERDAGLAAVIMGHTHREAISATSDRRWYINPGAWLDGGKYAILDHTGASLHRFAQTEAVPSSTN